MYFINNYSILKLAIYFSILKPNLAEIYSIIMATWCQNLNHFNVLFLHVVCIRFVKKLPINERQISNAISICSSYNSLSFLSHSLPLSLLLSHSSVNSIAFCVCIIVHDDCTCWECCVRVSVVELKVFFFVLLQKVASDCCCLLLLIAVGSCRLQVASCIMLLKSFCNAGHSRVQRGVCHPRDAAATSHLTLWWTVSTTATNEAGRKNWAAAGVAEVAHSRCCCCCCCCSVYTTFWSNRKICY